MENNFLAEFQNELALIKSVDGLEKLKNAYLGKQGKLNVELKKIGALAAEDRVQAGSRLNLIKKEIVQLIENKTADLENSAEQKSDLKNYLDVTEPVINSLGALHPISMVQYRLEDIFNSIGFEICDGPYIESDYFNFEALNFPKNHPARDSQDTFYLSDDKLLRTQTSTIQIRAMKAGKPPLRIVGPGKVFRAERIDASHSSVFHQIEGMMIDKKISVANMIHFLKSMLSELFSDDVKVRLRPGYFPFVEPGFEMEMGCVFCGGKGCQTCKNEGWIEILGCGLMHPNVLKAGNIDPKIYSGFAFGLGLDRLAMLKYSIFDIRLLTGGEYQRFLQIATPISAGK